MVALDVKISLAATHTAIIKLPRHSFIMAMRASASEICIYTATVDVLPFA